jgi:hypothetical protein
MSRQDTMSCFLHSSQWPASLLPHHTISCLPKAAPSPPLEGNAELPGFPEMKLRATGSPKGKVTQLMDREWPWEGLQRQLPHVPASSLADCPGSEAPRASIRGSLWHVHTSFSAPISRKGYEQNLWAQKSML